jgi:hypothetical protein
MEDVSEKEKIEEKEPIAAKEETRARLNQTQQTQTHAAMTTTPQQSSASQKQQSTSTTPSDAPKVETKTTASSQSELPKPDLPSAPASADKSAMSSSSTPTKEEEEAPVALERPNIWETLSFHPVQGDSLRTWSIPNPAIQRVEVFLKTTGRPLNADVQLWQGPENAPQKMAIYVEDGSLRPFRTVLETPRGSNTVAIRNIANLEFPLEAALQAGGTDPQTITGKAITIQGGAVRTYPFHPSVSSVQVLLSTDGRPLEARLELLQGPNNNKQVIELYCEDGLDRPFSCILETPGTGNVVRIVNTGTVEFPITAIVEPYEVRPEKEGAFVMKSQ